MIQIRRATEDDAAEIRRIHEAGIREICSNDYPPDVISAWLGGTSDERYRRRIAEQSYWIAKEESAYVGFVCADFPNRRLEGLFVDPSVIGKGVASRMLTHIEGLARELQIESLSLDSSLTAIAFYSRCGYVKTAERSELVLSSGVVVEGVPMQKQLLA